MFPACCGLCLTNCDEEDSADDGEEGSAKAAHEGHLGMCRLQPRDLRHIGHWISSYLPGQPLRKHTQSEYTWHMQGLWSARSRTVYHVLPYTNILACPDDPLQRRKNEVFKLLILSLNKRHMVLMRGILISFHCGTNIQLRLAPTPKGPALLIMLFSNPFSTLDRGEIKSHSLQLNMFLLECVQADLTKCVLHVECILVCCCMDIWTFLCGICTGLWNQTTLWDERLSVILERERKPNLQL